ncbi:MAG: sugar transferase [Vulcanimicrobiaceae bacterium]
MFVLSVYVATAIVFHRWNGLFAKPHEVLSTGIFVALWLAMFARLGLYRRSFALSARDELYYTIAALALGALPQLIVFTVWPSISTSRFVLIIALLLAIVLVGGIRTAEHLRRGRFLRRRPKHVAVVGNARFVADMEAFVARRGDAERFSFVVTDVASNMNAAWYDRAVAGGCKRIILSESIPEPVLSHVMQRAAQTHVELAFASHNLRLQGHMLGVERDGEQVFLVPQLLPSCTPVAKLVKRLFDIGVASFALVLLAPIMLAAALAIYLETGRPIVYRQARIGRSGAPFEMYKFRTMRRDAEAKTGPVYASLGDRRITAIGRRLRRFSLDETLQLINVIKGDMSLVGPRPERPEFVERFRAIIPRYEDRHLVRPGITGWAQTSLPRVLDASYAAEKLAYDLCYIENWSVLLDVSILVKTAFEVCFHRTI